VGTETDLEALSSRELHDLAMKHALHHMDVKFLWELLRVIPVAEEAEGRQAEAGADLTQMSALIGDAIDSGEAEDALRPLYIDYLRKHPPK
jgi:hypothetical protein